MLDKKWGRFYLLYFFVLTEAAKLVNTAVSGKVQKYRAECGGRFLLSGVIAALVLAELRTFGS